MKGRMLWGRPHWLLAAAALCISAPVLAGDAGVRAASGVLDYQVMRGEDGLRLGEAKHVWQYDGGRYSMELQLETTGLAGLLYNFQYTQRSEGQIGPQGLVPERFTVDQKGRAQEWAAFDWSTGKVVINRRGRQVEDSIAPGDQDVLSVWHMFAGRDAAPLPDEIDLVNNRRVSPATLQALGRESVELPVGRIDAERYRLQARSGKLTIDLWVSDAYRELPARILMKDDKGQVLDLQLLSATWPD